MTHISIVASSPVSASGISFTLFMPCSLCFLPTHSISITQHRALRSSHLLYYHCSDNRVWLQGDHFFSELENDGSSLKSAEWIEDELVFPIHYFF